jgi:ABC-type antimicrobial peptide transport system permease subunit
LTNAVRDEVWAIDRTIPIAEVQTMSEALDSVTVQPRFNMVLLVIFASVALVLTVVGIYGVMNFVVTQRTGEIGIRMALGARPDQVLHQIVGKGMTLTVLGLSIGAGGALAMTRMMNGLLYKVGTSDPVTFVLISALLLVVSLLACWIPARRAASIDPTIALRSE